MGAAMTVRNLIFGSLVCAATTVMFFISVDEALACNVQMGFPDSCYKDGPRGTEYGSPWGPGKAGQVVPGTESAQERAEQVRRAQQLQAEQIRRAQQIQAEQIQAEKIRREQIQAEQAARAKHQKIEAELEASRAEIARRAAAQLEAQRKEIEEQQRELQQAQKRLEEERAATEAKNAKKKDSALLSGKTAIGIALVAGFSMIGAIFKRGYPGQAISTGAIMSIGGLLISEFFGVDVKDGVTLAELPLFSPLGIGMLSLALTYKA